MNILTDAVRQWLEFFQRPAPPKPAVTAQDAAVDEVLDDVEQQQLELRAQLTILEKQSNPWGIGHDAG